MNHDQFQRMIAAYGAEPARWPSADRADAVRYLAEHPGASALMAADRALDDALDAWPAPEVSSALRERILAAAPVSRPAAARSVWAWPRLWLSGAGLAAACAAGAIAGATLIGPSLANAFPSDRTEAGGLLLDGVSAFGAPLDGGVGG
jgi:hypothetical protein